MQCPWRIEVLASNRLLAGRVEIFFARRPVLHHPQVGKPPFHSATPELLTPDFLIS